MRTTSAAMVLLLVLGLTLTGCKTTGGDATRDALCDQFEPIRWSINDTDGTAAQVKAHNAVGMKICGWRP